MPPCQVLPICQAFLEENHAVGTLFFDVLSRPPDFALDLDLYVAGPPCQDYSQAGFRKGADVPRGHFMETCLNFLSGCLPKVFV